MPSIGIAPRSKANSKSNGGVSTLGTSPCKRVRFQLESKVATLRGGLSQLRALEESACDLFSDQVGAERRHLGRQPEARQHVWPL